MSSLKSADDGVLLTQDIWINENVKINFPGLKLVSQVKNIYLILEVILVILRKSSLI